MSDPHDHPEDHLAERFADMDALDKVRWMVETDGWAIEVVQPRPDGPSPMPGYAYSIGVPDAFDFPDIVVFGLTPVAAKGLVGLVVDALRGGTDIPIGVELVGLLDNDLRCAFGTVDTAVWGHLFDTLRAWRGSDDGDIAQLLYPDRNGFLPYEAGYERRMRFAQPVVGAVG